MLVPLGNPQEMAASNAEHAAIVVAIRRADGARHYSKGRDSRRTADRAITRLKRQKNGFWKTTSDKLGKQGQ